MHGDMMPAPLGKIAVYLAIFRRFFIAAEEAGKGDDPYAMLLIGFMADALHNAPQILWHHNPEGFWKPAEVDAWVWNFPSTLARYGTPDPIIEHCRSIMSFTGVAEELGLPQELKDIRLPPLEPFYYYLDLMCRAFVNMRGMKWFGGNYPRKWDNLPAFWSNEATEAARWNGLFATALLPIPRAFVHWDTFDEAAFAAEVNALSLQAAGQDRIYYTRFFARDDTSVLG